MDRDESFPSPAHVATTPTLDELRSALQEFLSASKAKNTIKGYRSDFADFTFWCETHQRAALPATPETVALYLTHRARSLRTSTLERRLAAIGYAHRAARVPVPTTDLAVREVWAGIRREKGSTKRRKTAAITKLIKQMLSALPENLRGTRDRALLLLGYAGGFRRSELVALNVSDIELVDEGYVVNIRKSKTDQMGEGRTIGIPYGKYEHTCPVLSIKRWLEDSHIVEGPLFRMVDRHGNVRPNRLSDHAVAKVVKRSLAAAGIDASNFAGHSLRSGFATMAAAGGASERKIQDQTGHKSLLVLRRYIHDGQLFENSAVHKLGL